MGIQNQMEKKERCYFDEREKKCEAFEFWNF